MNVMELFRSGMDTVEIANHLGMEEWRADKMLNAAMREEHARKTGSKLGKPICRPEKTETKPKQKRLVKYAGYDARAER